MIYGRPLVVDTRKAMALLAYLAVTARPQSRDAIAGLLWPDSDNARARAALRRTLSTLKTSLPEGSLIATRATIELRGGDTTVDVIEFRDLLARSREHTHPGPDLCQNCVSWLSAAIPIYASDFLSGFTLRDSFSFEDWQLSEAEALRRELDEALEKLMHARAAEGALEVALDLVHRRLTIDPLNEAAHRDIMRILTWKGNRSAALLQYRECVALLQRELGVSPVEETTDLYNAITENRAGVLAPEPVASMKAPLELSRVRTRHEYPLVGRAREMGNLIGAHRSVQSDGFLVVIEGEAGVGKTRLCEEFLVRTATDEARRIAARCYEGEDTLAYGLIAQALSTAIAPDTRWAQRLRPQWLAEAARLAPELARIRDDLPSPPPLDHVGARRHFFEGVIEVVTAALEGPVPGVLLLEDLQWGDAASMELISFLVHRLRGRPLLLLMTWRIEDVDADDQLRRLLADSSRDASGMAMELARLNENEVAEFLELTSETLASDRKLSDRLYEESEGLPLFLIEYLKGLGDDPVQMSPWPLPGGVRDLLRERSQSVGAVARQLLAAGAVIGHSFDFDLVQRASGRSQIEAVAAVEELSARGLIVEASGNRGEPFYDFTHDKLRAYVYDELTPARKRILHRRVADSIRKRARPNIGAVSALLGKHYAQAGDAIRAADHYALAGDHARSLDANVEALDHYFSALGYGYEDAARLLESIGDLQTTLGDYSAAIASYEAAAASCKHDEVPRLEHKIGGVHLRIGEMELAESHLRSALAESSSARTSGLEARVKADLSLIEQRRGNVVRARTLADEALTMAEGAHDDHALAQVHNVIGMLASKRGELDQARQHLESALAIADDLADPAVRVAALNNLALVARANDDVQLSLALTRQALELCARQGDRHREAALHNNLADLLHAEGDVDEAMAHLKQAAQLFSEIGERSGGMLPEVWKLVEW